MKRAMRKTRAAWALYRAAVGENVQRRRQRKGWTQEDLARMAGLDRGQIAHVEQARGTPLWILWSIARGLGVDVKRLLP